MKRVNVPVLYEKGSQEPVYSSHGASGADIKAFLQQPLVIPPGGRALVPTGIRMEIPEGFECQVRPRSGLALKHGITVLNSPGTIDSDYRGEIKIILVNLGEESFTIENGDRIAQIVFTSVVQADFSAEESLESSNRGAGGFGSTGV
jgi:dUTP pyrophosphatase